MDPAKSIERAWFAVLERGEESRRLDAILSMANIGSVLKRVEMGDFVVYYIDTEKLRGACGYEECASAPKSSYRKCIEECAVRRGIALAKKIALAIRELRSQLR